MTTDSQRCVGFLFQLVGNKLPAISWRTFDYTRLAGAIQESQSMCAVARLLMISVFSLILVATTLQAAPPAGMPVRTTPG